MDTNQTAEEVTAPVCNCNDEYKTAVCPVHASEPKPDAGMIVMDDHMVEDEVRPLVGYCFKCPICDKPAILDMMNYCPNCGTKIVLRSHKVTAFINKAQGIKQ